MNKEKRNLLCYPIGTIGRDATYALFTNFIMLYILYTRQLTTEQLGAITAIMIAARVFDALNDPIMGNIIERTRGKFGKFKPWILAGVLSTALVLFLGFNSQLTGWNFVIFFGVIYFAWSITFTMHDISYWGMIPALSQDGDTRNKLTSRAVLCAGVGSTAVSVLVPLFTTGSNAIGGNAQTAYGIIALAVAIIGPIFIIPTLVGTKENREDMGKPAPKVGFKKIISTIGHNDQLLWASLILLILLVGNGIVLGGIGSNYIYFEFGYEGGLYSTFTTIGMMATCVVMILYPMISRRIIRQRFVLIVCVLSVIGYGMMLLAGLFMPTNDMKFWVITVGFMLANIGQYGMYLTMMIAIMNTVEYNELKNGTRDEAIITSMRPFITKMASSVTVLITTITYIITNLTSYTNQISDLEAQANQGIIDTAAKSAAIANVVTSVDGGQKLGLLISMTIVPLLLILISGILYRKFYTIDEEKYEEICKELASRG